MHNSPIGTLYIVSTPIGNLEDITIRAIHTLSSVDLIAAEDTRTTGNLLRHYEIRKPLISYHSYNEAQRTSEMIGKLQSGSSIGLVSDAGTPGISDPAFRLIHAALENEISVIAIPGASAFLPALIASGLPLEHFVFEGFLPVKKGRKKKIEELRSVPHSILLYESPYRVIKTLRELHTAFGEREICVARELTKKFEEIVRGPISNVIAYFTQHPPRGEFVLIVSGSPSTIHNF